MIRAINPNGVRSIRGKRFVSDVLIGPGFVAFNHGAHHSVGDGHILDQDFELIAALPEKFVENATPLGGPRVGDGFEFRLLANLQQRQSAHESRHDEQPEQEDFVLNGHKRSTCDSAQ